MLLLFSKRNIIKRKLRFERSDLRCRPSCVLNGQTFGADHLVLNSQTFGADRLVQLTLSKM